MLILISARKFILFGFCLLVIFCLQDTLRAASSLIVIPTARTQRDGTYYVAIERRGGFLNTTEQPTWTVKTKFGFKQSEAQASFDKDQNGNLRLRINAKYSIPLDPHSDTAWAFGFQSLGVGSVWTPYSVVSHRVGKSDLHFGLFDTEDRTLGWFTGADYLITPHLDLMADYTNGDTNEWSAGFEYTFSDLWKLKAGSRFRTDSTQALIEVKYTLPWK